MIGGKTNSRTSPTALGSMLQASTYGAVIANVIGLVKTPFLAIWAQNLREGGGGKKWKNKKKGVQNYIENIDFVLGVNPIMGIMQAWRNSTKLPLDYKSTSVSTSQFGTGSVTISDAQFYAVVAATATISYSATFNDYGGPGSISVSGSFEVPLWNSFFNGPDPIWSGTLRNWPYIYTWAPSQGATVLFPTNPTGNLVGISAFTIYYAAKSAKLFHETPAAYLRLTFEPTLADGPEYTGNIQGTSTPLSTQQVLMPAFAGAGSANYDLGASGAIADNRPEVLGSWTVYPNGDADFADMIELAVKSGIAQVSPAETSPTGPTAPVQSGVAASNYPGPVQMNVGSSAFDVNALPFRLANQANNFLLGFWTGHSNGGVAPTLSDPINGAWTTIDNGTQGGTGQGWVLAYVKCAVAAPGNLVSVTPSTSGFGNFFWIAELQGYDTFDSGATVTLTPGSGTINSSLTTTQPMGNPESVFCFTVLENFISLDPRWASLFAGYPAGSPSFLVQWRTVTNPGAVNIQETWSSAPFRLIMAAFKQQAAPPYPNPFGNFIDDASMQICRAQARAYGLTGAISMVTQRAARDYMKDFYSSMNCAPFESGGLLKQMPYGEVSTAANGAVYISPYASGPIANLSDVNGDFIGSKSDPPVTVERTSQLAAQSILQYEILSRASDYNPVVVSQPEAGSLALFGVRKASPESHHEITNPDTARILLGILARRQNFIRNMVSFKATARGLLWEPMDLLTVTETLNALSTLPVRLTSVEVGADWTVSCKSEPYVYGVHGPLPVVANGITPIVPNPIADPGSVNTPVLFEPVPRLFGSQSQPQLWGVLSGSSPDYAGCLSYVSTDGGMSFLPISNLATGNASVTGNGITGVSTADWPIASDPDTANNLALDLTESLGTLQSYQTSDRDNFTYPCYIAGGSAGIPYGLLTYNSATMTAANKYTLNATGAGNKLRRCVFGAPVPAPGPDVDHPNGSRFAFLGNASQVGAPGLMKLTLDPKWIGVTLQFKFLPVNTFGNVVTDLSSVTAYSFTPTGIPGSLTQPGPNSYTQTPAISVSQTNATTLAMATTATDFAGNTVNYNARTFTITDPGGTPIWYYIFIQDTGQTGDVGSGPTLTSYADTTQAKLGVPGYTYVGAIQAIHSGFASAVVLPGGYPPQQVNIIGS